MMRAGLVVGLRARNTRGARMIQRLVMSAGGHGVGRCSFVVF